MAFVVIRQCCQYNLQRLIINIAMCFFMSCRSYFIVFLCFILLLLFSYAEQGVDTFLLFACDDPGYDPSHSS